jgi:hypothetical protein
MQSKVEDLEERNDYYKKRIKRQDINSMGLATMMSNPYENTESNSHSETTKTNEEHQSSGKGKFRTWLTSLAKRGYAQDLSNPVFKMFTNKKKFMEEKVMVKNTKNKRLGSWAKTFLPLVQKGKTDDKKLRAAIFEGIPSELREVVW